MWLASSLKLYRNLDRFLFPGKLSIDQRKKVVEILSEPLLASNTLDQPTLLHAGDMSPLHKEFLFEHFLSTEGFHQAHAGEAFVHDQSGCFLGIINVRNHLQLSVLESMGELEKAFGRLAAIETHMGKTLKYAFSPEFGFLTADPGRCGSALAVQCFLHVPALIHHHELATALQKHSDDAIIATGLQGDPDDFIGDIVTLQNRFTLGVTEENILSTLRSSATHIMLEEKRARKAILKQEDSKLKDEVSRSFALLKHAFQMESVEAMAALSLLKLGLDLGWITGSSVEEINKLLLSCRRAHLIHHKGADIPNNELPHARAAYLHEALAKVEMKL
ncbi:MAG: protein arginine kinase [Chlamydiia bacterium]|nr:protein arginine kinase [Chlamydiia bacterium]